MYDLLKIFFLPFTLISIGMVTCIYLLFRRKYRAGRLLLIIVFLIYYLLSINPIAGMLSLSLMHKDEVNESGLNMEKAEAIVVLSGGVFKKGGYRPFHELSGNSWRRLWHGIEVYRELEGQVPIFYVGGAGKTSKAASVEAELAKSYAVIIGIPNEKLWTGTKSRNTYESGMEIKQVLDLHFPEVKMHKIILITSATHMMRAMMVMKEAGLNVVPSSADYLRGGLGIRISSFIPTVGNFSTSYIALHEWMGIIVYRMLGRI
jgi:uncharacterized SAM-binding protein YcdF (DUF218 family)